MRKQIEEYLLDLIASGDKYVHQPLPSENFIATKFKCSRQTARVELNRLLNKGFLRSVKGSGYYVNPFMSSLKITGIGSRYKFLKKEINEIPVDNLLDIVNQAGFKIDLNPQDYFGFRKVYFNNTGKPALYQNSYIYKKSLKEINLEIIKNSLMDFWDLNGVNLNLQINNLAILPSTKIDQEILNTNEAWIPTIWGMVISKEEQVIEIFERKFEVHEFSLNYAKVY